VPAYTKALAASAQHDNEQAQAHAKPPDKARPKIPKMKQHLQPVAPEQQRKKAFPSRSTARRTAQRTARRKIQQWAPQPSVER
jgi:hypothetical protein